MARSTFDAIDEELAGRGEPNPRSTQFIVIKGAKLATLTTAVLVERSAWFEFMPFPDDEYRVTFKPEQGHYIRGFVRGASETIDRQKEIA